VAALRISAKTSGLITGKFLWFPKPRSKYVFTQIAPGATAQADPSRSGSEVTADAPGRSANHRSEFGINASDVVVGNVVLPETGALRSPRTPFLDIPLVVTATFFLY